MGDAGEQSIDQFEANAELDAQAQAVRGNLALLRTLDAAGGNEHELR